MTEEIQGKNMNIGAAVTALRRGFRVSREGWNGRDMYLYFVGERTVEHDGEEITLLCHVRMKTVQGDHVPWLCSQTDLLAYDWFIVDD